MSRIEIANVPADEKQSGRPLMSDHNLSARLWASAALLAVPIASRTSLGWWLPVHLALLGAASQAIIGGQLMFSATLGLARGPARAESLTQLALVNAGAALVILGRLVGSTITLAAGAIAFVIAIVWVIIRVDRLWRVSANRRFAMTGTFYRLAGISVFVGATIGGAIGLGWFDDATSYLAHRSIHMTINVLGWTGLTIVGTAITLLPTILHVRAPKLHRLRFVPVLMFGGLTVLASGASIDIAWLAATGLVLYAVGLGLFATYVVQTLAVQSRRAIPAAALHLVAALVWLALTTVMLVVGFAAGDAAVVRDVVVVGGAGGVVFQALMGAWSFLLPSTRPPVPERRRRELMAMEIGARPQVIAYNAGLIAILVGLRTAIDISLIGIVLAWAAAAWVIAKTWTFPLLATLPSVAERSDRWWAPPEG